MTDLTIATEVNTGALVITAAGGLRVLPRLRRGVTGAVRQRPAAVVLDLSNLPAGCVLPALAVGLTRRRRGVPLLARVPASLRALRRVPGITPAPLPELLATLPGLGLAEARVCARFGPDVHAAGAVRALVGEALAAWHAEHLNPDAQLIASELVSNAVEHARTDVDFRLLKMRYGVCIAVHDEDPHPPAIHARGRTSLRGRGLRIVARTADRWGCLIGTADKIVWAALRDRLPRGTLVASAT